jgi:hypothetical protein
MATADVLTSSPEPRAEHRARRFAGGIEIQTWRLVETRTYPESAGSLNLRELLEEEGLGCTLGAADDLQMPLPWGRRAP